ncbi:MAG: hypothetical protein LUG52_10580 [Clostridia bacterium]|nr:hypothetical protein [Clostridia bacterium]
MAYEKHEMKVLLFSKSDSVFTDTYDELSDEDNITGGDALTGDLDGEESFKFSDQ